MSAFTEFPATTDLVHQFEEIRDKEIRFAWREMHDCRRKGLRRLAELHRRSLLHNCEMRAHLRNVGRA